MIDHRYPAVRTVRLRRRLAALLVLLAAGSAPFASAFVDGADRNLSQWGNYGEWTLTNGSYGGNPFDLVASATFVHQASGETRTTPMFYAGANQWKFRFTATRTGTWRFTTQSGDPELNGRSGQVNVANRLDYKGFVTQNGPQWARSATGEVFTPQFVMYAGPHYFGTNQAVIDADINRFLVAHGFTGLHVPVYCRWFDRSTPNCNEVGNSNPDASTFEALELLIRRVYVQGGSVHLWAWGDAGRNQNPLSLASEGGINGPADLRLQRYIAARLGPLPGWTMGYGFDLFEWVGGGDLTFWRNHMQNLMGWRHLLGARGSTNSFAQPSEAMDYASYETHQPGYAAYRTSFTQRPGKPSFSEDRFRYRGNAQRSKDYTLAEMARGMWHSTMAGGVANIWGNLTSDGSTHDAGINEGERPSSSFNNIDALRTYRRFFQNRFEPGLINCDGDGDAACQRRADNSARTLYRESTNTITVNLSGHVGGGRLVAVDTRRGYSEIDLGPVPQSTTTVQLPYASDWAVAIGWNGVAAPPPDPAPPPTNDTVAPSRVLNLNVN